VGGVSVPTFEKLVSNFGEYQKLVPEIVKIRRDAFDDVYNSILVPDKKEQKYKEIRNIVCRKRIISTQTEMRQIQEFFNSFPGMEKNKYYFDFINKSIDRYVKELKPKRAKIAHSKIDDELFKYSHFIHAQLSYFMFKGGKNFRLSFKKRMFLSIFGIITKRSYRILDVEDFQSMKIVVKNMIEKDITHNKKVVKLHFEALPHYIFS
jgi:hypothetical protein